MALVPKINLRLTDEEHEALRSWAQESHRSIQREAVFRLFSEKSLSERGQKVADAPRGVLERAASDVVGSNPTSAASRSESDFKGPDFK